MNFKDGLFSVSLALFSPHSKQAFLFPGHEWKTRYLIEIESSPRLTFLKKVRLA